LRDLAQENVHAVIDLQGAAPGEHTYDLTTDQIQAPHDVEVMQVTPTRLRMVFDKSATRQIAIRPRVVGTLPPGYRIESVTADPAMLTITGPARRVNAIESALTDTVDATGVAGQSSFETMAYLPDPLVHTSGSGPIHVIVTTQKISSKDGVP
jgi:YbbR domain-containing protein